MRLPALSAFWLLFLLLAPSSDVSRCEAVVIHESYPQEGLSQSSERFMFWEKCEDKWNKDKKRTERCCKGNYKCSSKQCKGNRLCKFVALWCYNKSCKAKKKKGKKDKDKKKKGKKDKKDKKDKDKKKKDKDKDKKKDEDDEPQASGEDEEEENDYGEADENEDENEDEDEDKDDEDEKSSPSPTPSPSLQPSPSVSPSPSPSPSTAAPVSDPLNCDGQRNRREIRDLSAEERRRWQGAVLQMRADRDESGDSAWDLLVRTHMQNADEAHGGSYFLPWHRLYLLRLENALRRYEPELALPYWDWSIDAADAAMSDVWGAGFVGGARRGNQAITNGPFENMDGRYPSQHVVRRDFTSGTSREIALLWSMSSLDQVINAPTFGEFSDAIESAHALPHIYIGGDMADSWLAPNDPVFWIHHAFVDRLYKMRQNRRGNWDFGGTHDFSSGTAGVSNSRILGAFGVPVSRAFDLSCVNYVAPRLQGRSVGGRAADDACGNEAFQNGHSMSRERCERGNALLHDTA